MDFGSSTVEDFHSEAVPSLRSVRTGIFIAQRTLITTRSSFRSEMDVAPKGAEIEIDRDRVLQILRS